MTFDMAADLHCIMYEVESKSLADVLDQLEPAVFWFTRCWN